MKEKPALVKEGSVIGIDRGYLKLAVTSESQVLGTDMPRIARKIANKVKGSKSQKATAKERDAYIDSCAKQVDIIGVKVIVLEDLTGLKVGKKNKSGSRFRQLQSSVLYKRFATRLESRCTLLGVRVAYISPAYTSQTCSTCGACDREYRCGEMFRCGICHHTQDADINASLNIRSRYFSQDDMVPGSKPKFQHFR